MTDKQKLALRVNEIFHDIEGRGYQKKHADIFTGELNRWKKNAEKLFQNYITPITILDIGTGTGFIPLSIAEFLSDQDTFICSDISQEMLNVSKSNIEKLNFKCKFSFLKLNGKQINTDKVTIVTLNSVVHHIPDLELFFNNLNKIVLPGGRIIIGHEPNKLFYSNKFLVNLFLFLQLFSSFKKFATTIARTTRLNVIVNTMLKMNADNNSIISKINKILIKEEMIIKHLTKDEINKMIDYHSPSAGAKIDLTKGIDIEKIQKKYLTNFNIEYFETYNFISKMSNKNILMKKINNLLSQKYKMQGATFFVILKKKNIIDEN